MTTWGGPSSLDRVPGTRGNDQLDAAWARAVVLSIDGEGRVASAGGRPVVSETEGPRGPADIYLGDFAGRPWFARPVVGIEGESISWREAPAEHYDPLAAAVFLTHWATRAPLCERCGVRTEPDQGGIRRMCPGCGSLSFARIDPCVIVAITDPDDRLLLARNVAWPEHRVSIIAGFIEAGESVEQAVHREVGEEVGVTLGSLGYVSSQPWPMPRSLMLGFEARALDDRIRVDGEEIVRAAYYERAELIAAVSDGALALPGGASIARHLIDRWLASGS